MLINPARSPYSGADRALIGRAHAAEVLRFLAACPAHRPTPLAALPGLAAELDVGAVFIKAEWDRMGLGSFKALGGAYAVARLVMERASLALGRPVSIDELAAAPTREAAASLTVVCASAGNHGLSVAAGARAFGARAVVYLNEMVSERFAARLRDQDAEVARAGATYEDSLAAAMDEATRRGWSLVTDTAGPDAETTAVEVMRGYTVLFEEAAATMEAEGGPASHVFLQAGVGGLAAAGAGYLRDRWGEDFRLVVVEPEGAPCLLESARAGRLVRITGAQTRLGRLDCKEPSAPAFTLLAHLADAFVLVSDDAAEAAARRLGGWGSPVSACGAAGAAGLIGLGDADRRRLQLDARSRVLLVGTEAAEA